MQKRITWLSLSLVLIVMLIAGISLNGCQTTTTETTAAETTVATEAETTAVAETETEAAKEPWEIVYVNTINGPPYFAAQEMGIKKAAEELGVNAYMTGPKDADAAQQVAVIQDLITKSPDAIICLPSDPNAVVPVFEKAREAGILVISHESPLNQQGIDWDFEITNTKLIAEKSLDVLVSYMGEEGEYAELIGNITTPMHNIYMDSIEAYAAEKYPKLKLATERLATNENQETARTITLDLIKAYPNLKGIVTDGSINPPGAGQAIKEKGLEDQISVVGLTLPTMVTTQLADGSVKAVLIWDIPLSGYGLVWWANYILDGNTPTNGMEIPNIGPIVIEGNVATANSQIVVTKDNVDQVIKDMGLE